MYPAWRYFRYFKRFPLDCQRTFFSESDDTFRCRSEAKHLSIITRLRLFTVPYFFVRCRDTVRLTVNGGHFDFRMYRGGECWEATPAPLLVLKLTQDGTAVTQSARSGRSYRKIEDCEQPKLYSTNANWLSDLKGRHINSERQTEKRRLLNWDPKGGWGGATSQFVTPVAIYNKSSTLCNAVKPR